MNSSPVVMDIWKYDAEGENHIYRIDAWYDLAYNYGLTGGGTFDLDEGYQYVLNVYAYPNISGGGLENHLTPIFTGHLTV